MNALMDDNGDMTRVEITACDASGTPVPWAANTVAMHVSGPHRFLGAENGDRLDFTALRSPQRRLYFGKLASFYGATADAGDITQRRPVSWASAMVLQVAKPLLPSISMPYAALRWRRILLFATPPTAAEPNLSSASYDATSGEIHTSCTIHAESGLMVSQRLP